MNKILRKFRKLKKGYQIFFIVVSVLFLLSIGFITQGLLLLQNIETLLRIIFLVSIYIGYFIFLFVSIILLFSRRNKLFISNSIFVMLLSIIFLLGGIYIYKTYCNFSFVVI